MTALPADGSTLYAPHAGHQKLEIRKLSFNDMGEALRRGVQDWRACRSETLMLACITPIAAVLFGAVAAAPNLLPFLFPICAGFALIGPMVTLWFASLSRTREASGNADAEAASAVFDTDRLNTIQPLCLITMGLFLVWLAVAGLVYANTLGQMGTVTGLAFFTTVLTTPAGWEMIGLGYLTGALFALFALGVGLVSFPLALDRDVTVTEALGAGLRALIRNPAVVLGWGALVTFLMILGTLPALLGLAVVLPILGHATWHMYRRIVV